MGSKGIVNLDMIHSKDLFMKVVHEVFDDMYQRVGESFEEYYWKLQRFHNQERIVPNNYDDVMELKRSIFFDEYEHQQVTQK
ncbi:hypothetical protein MKX03_034426, partial [Papaver bracteatum]